MPQIPALFLPKQKDNGTKANVKTAPEKKQFKEKQKKQTQRIAILLA